MELIKPFLKYSRPYRSSTNKNVRRSIHRQWSKETTKLIRDNAELMPPQEERCVFCNETTNAKMVFCKYCFFPQMGQVDDEEFITYCLLSVCYYEESNDELAESIVSSQRTVYKQRLKMTWYDHERMGKTYEVIYPQCCQCNSKTQNLGTTFIYFDERMFCINCMFPLFQIIIFNK